MTSLQLAAQICETWECDETRALYCSILLTFAVDADLCHNLQSEWPARKEDGSPDSQSGDTMFMDTPQDQGTFFLSVAATNQVSPLVLAFSLHIMSFFPEVLGKNLGKQFWEMQPWIMELKVHEGKGRCRYLLEHGT